MWQITFWGQLLKKNMRKLLQQVLFNFLFMVKTSWLSSNQWDLDVTLSFFVLIWYLLVILPTGIQFIGRNRIICLALLSLSMIAITDSG